MATIIKKTTGAEVKYTIQFDTAPTAQQLKKAINDLPDNTVGLKRVEDSLGVNVKTPVRFVFISSSQVEEDVPQA